MGTSMVALFPTGPTRHRLTPAERIRGGGVEGSARPHGGRVRRSSAAGTCTSWRVAGGRRRRFPSAERTVSASSRLGGRRPGSRCRWCPTTGPTLGPWRPARSAAGANVSRPSGGIRSSRMW